LVCARQGPAALDRRRIRVQTIVQNRGLQIVQARVQAPANDFAVGTPTVIPQFEDAAVHLIVVGRHCSAVSQASQELGRKETNSRRHSEAGRSAPPKTRAECLRRIFDQQQAVPIRDRLKLAHVGRAAVQLRR